MESADKHLLTTLQLPDRFERLQARLGAEVVSLLVRPPEQVVTAFATAAANARARGEGLFIPLVGASGTGKTTLASSLSFFNPDAFLPTIPYNGPVSYDGLSEAVRTSSRPSSATGGKLQPMILDHREGDPPTDAELGAIKRFLRAPSPGSGAILLWPDIDDGRAKLIADKYLAIAGESPIPLPFRYSGPDRSQWTDIILNTMRLCNSVSDVEDLGVDPTSYSPTEFQTIGAFFRKVSIDFHHKLIQLLSITKKPLSLAIIVTTQDGDPGVLSILTNRRHNGLLDGRALIDSTPESVMGKWWAKRAGLLSQIILQLNARAYVLAPPVVVSSLQMYGSASTKKILKKGGAPASSPSIASRNLSRSDFGKYLCGKLKSSSEDRGTPATSSSEAYEALADAGFTYGKDKTLNAAMADAIRALLAEEKIVCDDVISESSLDFCPLIPDNTIRFAQNYVCIEYTWRKANWLERRHKSQVAQYTLGKLKSYGRELGWIPEA